MKAVTALLLLTFLFQAEDWPVLSSRLYVGDSTGKAKTDVVFRTRARREGNEWRFDNEVKNQSPVALTVVIVTPRKGCWEKARVKPTAEPTDLNCQIPLKLGPGEAHDLLIMSTKNSQPVEATSTWMILDSDGKMTNAGPISIYWPSDMFGQSQR